MQLKRFFYFVIFYSTDINVDVDYSTLQEIYTGVITFKFHMYEVKAATFLYNLAAIIGLFWCIHVEKDWKGST